MKPQHGPALHVFYSTSPTRSNFIKCWELKNLCILWCVLWYAVCCCQSIRSFYSVLLLLLPERRDCITHCLPQTPHCNCSFVVEEWSGSGRKNPGKQSSKFSKTGKLTEHLWPRNQIMFIGHVDASSC